LSCFTLNEDGTVTCPMGNILQKTKKKAKKPYTPARILANNALTDATIQKHINQ